MSNSHHQFGGVCGDEIVLWVRKKTGFAVTTIQGKDEAEFFLSKKVTAVLGFFDKLEGPEHDAFIDAAKTEVDTEFVLTTVPEVAQMFINPSLDCSEQAGTRALLCLWYGFWIMLFAERKDYELVNSLYLKAAKDFEGKIMFLVVDLEDEEFSKPVLAAYGLDTGKPVVPGLNNEDGSRYHLESDFTYENLKEFAADLYAGKLTLYFKSEPVPDENEGLVQIVVGKNVEEIVMDDTKGIFPYEVPNYPSLLLYPAGRKSSKPILAKSQTSWKKLLVFLKEKLLFRFLSPRMTIQYSMIPMTEKRQQGYIFPTLNRSVKSMKPLHLRNWLMELQRVTKQLMRSYLSSHSYMTSFDWNPRGS